MKRRSTKSAVRLDNAAFDAEIMARAIRLARRGEGFVEPNPMVGCVIARGTRILGEGAHRRFGGPHAEIEALRSCRESPKGSTVYVTLEPCAHFGKTPPCVDALIEAGVARVVAAHRDPHPLVRGRGFRKLKSAGIEVLVGVLSDEASELLAPFLTRIRLGRPYVIAKWAQSLDGKLATETGSSQWISGPIARRAVHRLRARVDAIVVGSGTVIQDDPMLTARDVPIRRRALRVVLDRRLRIPESARLMMTAEEFPTLVVTDQARLSSAKAKRIQRLGVQLVGRTMAKHQPSSRAARARHIPLGWESVLTMLAERDAANVLVEGGPTVLESLFAQNLVDESWTFTAPFIIGGVKAPSVRRQPVITELIHGRRPKSVRVHRLGSDVVHRIRWTDPNGVSGP